MMRLCGAILVILVCGHGAWAKGCTRSLDYLMNDMAGELPLPAKSYQRLYQICVETLGMSNVRDAYILRDGGIAVMPRRSSVIATAETLAAFCRTFPRGTVRFLTPREMRNRRTVGLIVLLSSTSATPCKNLTGGL